MLNLLVAAGCSESTQHLEDVSATLAKLPDITDQNDPSRGARVELTAAKHALVDWIEVELTSGIYRGTPAIDAKEFAAFINNKLPIAGGRLNAVRAWSHNGVLVVATSFGIVCGTDDSVYGWAWNGKNWQRAFSHEMNDYTAEHYHPQSIDQLEAVHFSPADPANEAELYILTTAVNTWCTSGWLGRRFQLYYLDKTTMDTKLLVDDQVDAFTNEGDRDAKLSQHRLTIDYTGNDFDPRKMPFGRKVKIFTLDKGKATPVPWAAVDAEDFMERWLLSPWDQSAAASVTDNRMLETWHRRLHPYFLNGPRTEDQWSSFAAASQCRDDASLWQYGIIYGKTDADTDLTAIAQETECRRIANQPANACTAMPTPGLYERLQQAFRHPSVAYFVMRQVSPNTFSMIDIRERPRPGCITSVR